VTSELQEPIALAQAQARPLVWVVDDDPGIRVGLDRLFRATALEVESFESGSKMFDRLPCARPRCLVLDLELPGLDGLEIFRALRQQGEAIPVVFITGKGTIHSSVEAMKDGAIDFLEKPLDADALLRAVMRGLAQEAERRMARASRRGQAPHREPHSPRARGHGPDGQREVQSEDRRRSRNQGEDDQGPSRARDAQARGELGRGRGPSHGVRP
jgi:FixJ family two-component response regulator